MTDAIQVAVRCRPFNRREIKFAEKKYRDPAKQAESEYQGSLVVRMDGATTYVRDRNGEESQKFAFDFSYWSHDPADPHFVTNQDIYRDLGEKVLENAWDGYNACLFAYGQTGSGKSYSMFGSPGDPGVIPQVLEELFKRIDAASSDPNVLYDVKCAMMEIYNEKVRDLLNSSNPGNKKGLRVRQDPKRGVVIKDLQYDQVQSYADIENLIRCGFKNRTVSATAMNQDSSRAHTIVQFKFSAQRKEEVGGKELTSTKDSTINLVDLAGSERVDKTGAEGDRLREGIGINQSLTNLGNCIKKLAALCDPKKTKKQKKKIHVPYRDSQLTWLLKESLGGNSRTIMIAAISPAGDNYDETISTLRYANRAKEIRTSAQRNEGKKEKIIRELKEELERLKLQVAAGGGAGVPIAAGMSPEELERRQREHEEYLAMKERIEENEVMMRQMEMTMAERIAESQRAALQRSKTLHITGGDQHLRDTTPHILNLHQDPIMAETVVYFFREGGPTRIVRDDVDPPPGKTDIQLQGLRIESDHAVVEHEDGQVVLSPNPVPGSDPPTMASVFVNGKRVQEPVELHHNDRVIFGIHHYFRMVHPQERDDADDDATASGEEYDFSFAQRELNAEAMAQWEDPKAREEREQAEQRLRELEEQMEADKQRMEEEQRRLDQRYQEIFEEQEAARKKELETARRKLEEQADAKTQEVLKAQLEAREAELEEERRKEQEKYRQEQEEWKREQAELRAELEKKERLTNELQRKREIEDRDREMLDGDLMRCIPLVTEANTMTGVLGKENISYRVKLRKKGERTHVLVNAVDRDTGADTTWPYEVFAERLFLMREAFERYNDGADDEDVEDPFAVESGGPQPIGTSRIYLMGLNSLLSTRESTPIFDYKGKTQGQLYVNILPVPPSAGADGDDDSGAEDDVGGMKRSKTRVSLGFDGEDVEDYLFEEDSIREFIGEPFEVRVEIARAMGIPKNLSANVFCEFTYHTTKDVRTPPVPGPSINPDFNFARSFIFTVDESYVTYTESGILEITVYGEPARGAKADRPKASPRIQPRIEIERIQEILTTVEPPPSQPDTERSGSSSDVSAAAHVRTPSVADRVELLVQENQQLKQATSGGTSASQREEEYRRKVRDLEERLKKQQARLQQLTQSGDVNAVVAEKDEEIERLRELVEKRNGGDGADAAQSPEVAEEIRKLREQNEQLERELATQKNSKSCVIL